MPNHSSRFSSINVFKLKSSSDTAPPPPPKDAAYPPNLTLTPPPSVFYNRPFFSRSTASLSPESNSGPATPSTPYPPMGPSEFGKRSNGRAMAASPVPSASGASFRSIGRAGIDYPLDGASTDSSGSCPNVQPDVRNKKSVFKLASLAKRNKSKKDLSDGASGTSRSTSTSVSEQDDPAPNADGDDGISMPWNFQHNIHVDEGYIGLPPSWSAALSQVGFDDEEIAAIHARRRAASSTIAANSRQPNPYTTYSSERPASPQTITVNPSLTSSSSTILLDPAPRSTSLGKGHDALRIHPPSMSSMTTSAPPTASAPSRSPRTPSFSMRSFVTGIKNTLSTDPPTTRGVQGGGPDDSEPYVIVEGDGPDEGEQALGDETLIEPYPLDASSVSSHQTNSSRRQDDQQTPRTYTFPQIQVHRALSESGRISVASSVSRSASPLSHTHSLPIPTPPRGYSYSNNSLSVSPSHTLSNAGARQGPISAPPRTPPRRIYHVTNISSDSCDDDPPPAYFSPKKEEWPKKEKEVSGVLPLPRRPIPPLPAEGTSTEPSSTSDQDSRDSQEVSTSEGRDSTTGSSMDGIPKTADEILDITSSYNGDSVHEGDSEMPPQQARVTSPTPPLVIDKRMSKLAVMPPRISLHQEGDLEDWSKSLFSAIGKGKRSSVLIEPSGGNAASVKKERRTTIRPISPPDVHSGPSRLPDISIGANLTLGFVTRSTIHEERDEQEKVEAETEAEAEVGAEEASDDNDNDEKEEVQAGGAPVVVEEQVKETKESPVPRPTPVVTNVRMLAKALESPPSKTSPPQRPSTDSLPPSPPPKPKRMPPPIILPSLSSSPLRTNVITGISAKSPVTPLFSAKPQPLPVPISPSQIRAQLRPPPPKLPPPPVTLPLPPLKRTLSQPNLQPPPPPPQSQLPPIPSQKILKPTFNTSPSSPAVSRSNSSQTLAPSRASPGDRDSGLSTITVTPATIATAKVVRKAVASFIDPDTVSLHSKRESVASTADPEPKADDPDANGAMPHTQVPDDSMVSEVSSVSLLRDGSQSKWPAPPPPPVELETDSSTRRVSRFRTTSLGRVTQLQAMGVSPTSSHSSQGSSDTTSTETSESASVVRAVNGSSATAPKLKISLAAEARLLSSTTGTFGGIDIESGSEDNDAHLQSLESSSSESPTSAPPIVHPLLTQLQPYIAPRNPTSCFTDLVEIAEGESGSVFAARVLTDGRQGGAEKPIPPGTSHVAIKRIPLPPAESLPLPEDSPISSKLTSVLHELSLLRNLDHEHLLLPDGVYVGPGAAEDEDEDAESVDVVDTSLWIRMELMERSLADVIGLVADGVALQERLVARFACDVLNGLDYLQRQHIAHRDVRSDNLLVNASGVVKLSDFSNAIRVDRNAPMVSGAVGVIYWQAPEMRAGPYNALKVDVWSLGATVWELAETVPPFSMPTTSHPASFALSSTRHVGSQWPPMKRPENYSRVFHEFLRLCGRESAGRPSPGELLNTSFIRNACGRPVILQLLSRCRAIEETMAAKESAGSPS